MKKKWVHSDSYKLFQFFNWKYNLKVKYNKGENIFYFNINFSIKVSDIKYFKYQFTKRNYKNRITVWFFEANKKDRKANDEMQIIKNLFQKMQMIIN